MISSATYHILYLMHILNSVLYIFNSLLDIMLSIFQVVYASIFHSTFGVACLVIDSMICSNPCNLMGLYFHGFSIVTSI